MIGFMETSALCILGGTFAHSQTTQPTFDFPETKGRYHVHKKIGEGKPALSHGFDAVAFSAKS